MSRRASLAVLALLAIGVGAIAVPTAIGDLSTSHSAGPVVYPNHISVSAKCAGKGTHVGFGGFKLDTKANNSGAYSFPDGAGPGGGGADNWRVTAHNRSAIYDGKLDTYAYCFKGPKPKVVKKTKIINEGAHEVGATCPKSKTLIGGGWSSDALTTGSGVVALTGLERSPGSPREWDVSVFNERSDSVKLTAIAICGKGKKPSQREQTADVKEGHEKGASAQCKKGDELVFGGMEAEYADLAGRAAFLTRLYRSDDDEITAYGLHNSVPPNYNDKAQIKAIAYCR